MLKASLPNDWSYELAEEVVRDYVQRNFVDKRNRKQWKCYTEDSTDWNSRENAKKWRKDLADTINTTNEQLGIAVHWERRSFKEQGIDREPTA